MHQILRQHWRIELKKVRALMLEHRPSGQKTKPDELEE